MQQLGFVLHCFIGLKDVIFASADSTRYSDEKKNGRVQMYAPQCFLGAKRNVLRSCEKTLSVYMSC